MGEDIILKKTISEIRQAAKVVARRHPELDKSEGDPSHCWKYIARRLEQTIEESLRVFHALNPQPSSRIFEIGPGSSYMMKIFQDAGHDVSGCDIKNKLYDYIRAELGIDTVMQYKIESNSRMDCLVGKYDRIIALNGSYAHQWDISEFHSFADVCLDHLTDTGYLCLHFNAKRLPQPLYEIYAEYEPLSLCISKRDALLNRDENHTAILIPSRGAKTSFRFLP